MRSQIIQTTQTNNFSIMSFRQIVSKLVFPTLERDLSRSMATEMSTASEMVENMLAPSLVYGYATAKSSGAFQASGARHEFVKVHYPITKEGLFQDKESWH
ncbi:hypothetical protein MPSEU_000962900 [Mayamaea pseudoterrestris]|nr:hypothetical protein MPSEU_000962900 [Mayamaea pseudoterrestris]